MPDIDALTSAVKQLGSSFNFWNNKALWLIAATAVVAAAYFIASWIASDRANKLQDAQTALNRAKDVQLEKDLREKDRQIADLTNQNLALEMQVAEAYRRIDPRQLTPTRLEGLRRKLDARATKGAIDILCVGERHSEACTFAHALAGALKRAGWTVGDVQQTDLAGLSLLSDNNLNIKRSVETTGLSLIVERIPMAGNPVADLEEALKLAGFFAAICVSSERAGKPPLLLVGPKRLRS